MLSTLIPTVTTEGPVSVSLVVYGSALAAVVASLWALLERHERMASQKQNNELSTAFRNVIEQHYKERSKADEQSTLAQESHVRNVLASIERMISGKQSG